VGTTREESLPYVRSVRKVLWGTSAFFKESLLGGQNRKKRQNEKYEPSRFGERASLKRFCKTLIY
jgi:hypothetical protein